MTVTRVRPRVLANHLIAEVERSFAAELGLGAGHRSVALVTCDIDDALYVALDEATKAADVDVVLARSMYAGADHASGPFSGEAFGVLAAPDVDQARAGLRACVAHLADAVWFEQVAGAVSPAYFAHAVSSCGGFLSREAGVPRGTSLAYLIAPPLEATVGVEHALKQADVALAKWYPPPSETNYAGALLSGDQSAVLAATEAFRSAVHDIVRTPLEVEA